MYGGRQLLVNEGWLVRGWTGMILGLLESVVDVIKVVKRKAEIDQRLYDISQRQNME